MTEENQTETEVAEAESTNAPQPSPLFKALYEADEPAAPEPEPEPESIPQTLSEAIEGFDEPEPEPELEPEQPEPVPESADPVKSEPKVKKIRQVVDPDIPTLAPDPTFTREAPEEDEFSKTLLPEEREVYDLAKYASSNMEEYRGTDKHFKEYFEKSKSYIEKRVKEDPHVDLSRDEDYKRFIAQERPRFSNTDARKVEHAMIADKAEKRALEKMRPELERVRMEQERAQKAPVVHNTKIQLRKTAREIIPEEYRESLDTEEGLKKLADENPFEYRIMDGVTNYLTGLADTFIEISSGVSEYDPNNEVHSKLLGWVEQEQESFIQTGQTTREGKVFMRRERFHQLPEDKRSEYYTWSDEDLLMILTLRAKQRLDNELQGHRNAMTRAGYSRNGAAPQQQQPAQPVQHQQPPRATSAPRQGPGVGTQAQKKQNAMLSILGM